MIIDIILLSIAFIALTAGTITDIKTREVPDWINFSIIFSGIGLRLIYSVITFNWSYLLYGLFGLGIFVILGYIMFYAGQWGGGDSKMLMGLGALLGFNFKLNSLFIILLLNILLVGAVYGMIYSIVLAIINRKSFVNHFNRIRNQKTIKKFMRNKSIVFIVLLLVLVILFIQGKTDTLSFLFLLSLIIILNLTIYLFLFIKTVEAAAMFKFIPPEELTEGDWIANDVIIDKKRITGPKDLGIEKAQIKQLIELRKKGKINKVKVKYGIPFVPSFLIAYIITLMFGAWWLILF